MAHETQFFGIQFTGTLGDGTGDSFLTVSSSGIVKKVPTFSAGLSSSLLSGKMYVGNASNVATAQTISGDISIDNAGVAAISSGVIVNGDINSSAAIAYSKLNLSGSIVNADINSSAAITYSKLSLSGSIVNADINSSAAITRTKLATGTSYRILANNGTGVISENAALTAGRAIVSDGNGQLLASSTTATEIGYVSGVTSSIQTQLSTKIVAQATSSTLQSPGSGQNGYAITWDNTNNRFNLTPVTASGVPNGGTTNQILRKKTNTDQDTEWHTLVLGDITDVSAAASDVNLLSGLTGTITTANLSYLSGSTGNIQSQINSLVTGVNGTTNRITVTGTTNPTVDIASTYIGQNSITTVGTLTAGSTGSGFTVALGTSTITGTLSLANGGTGTTLSNPGADRLWGWDNTDGAIKFITIGTNLSYNHSTHTLSATGVPTLGSANQIPRVNSGATDFAYSPNFSYDVTNNVFRAASNVTISGTGTQNNNFYLGNDLSVTVSSGTVARWNQLIGDSHILSNQGSSGRFINDCVIYGGESSTLSIPSTYNSSLADSGIFSAYQGLIEAQSASPLTQAVIVLGGILPKIKATPILGTKAFGNFTLAGVLNISDGNGSGAMGYYSQSSGLYSLTHGFVTTYDGTDRGGGILFSGTVPTILASGKHAFNFSSNSPSQISGYGALADYSGILGGYDHHIPSDSPQSMIFGGSGISARAADPNQVYVPNFNIVTTPLNDDTLTQVMVRDGTTGQIKYRTASSFGGGSVTSVSGTSNRITSTGGTAPVIDIAATYVGQTSITTLGTIATGTWQATPIGAVYGGTGQPTVTTGDLLYGSGTNTWGKLAAAAANNVLLSGSTPSWGKVTSSHVDFIDTDGTLAANSDTKVASQKATKTYVDTVTADDDFTLVYTLRNIYRY